MVPAQTNDNTMEQDTWPQVPFLVLAGGCDEEKVKKKVKSAQVTIENSIDHQRHSTMARAMVEWRVLLCV